MANDPVFARAVDADDALDEVAEYDAFRDGFLVLPTLQSMYVSLFSLFPFLSLLIDLWVTTIIDWLQAACRAYLLLTPGSSFLLPRRR